MNPSDRGWGGRLAGGWLGGGWLEVGWEEAGWRLAGRTLAGGGLIGFVFALQICFPPASPESPRKITEH